MPSKSVWFAAISVMMCSLWLNGCATGILGSKDSKEKNPVNEGTTNQSRLTKLSTPKDRASGPPAKGANAEKSTAERASYRQSDFGKDIADSGADGQRSSASTSEASKRGASARISVLETSGNPSREGKSPPGTSSKADPPFKRHDHKKYMQKIKNKAIDKLNKEQGVTYATLCKDSTTDEWSLWIYKSQSKTYQFAAYSWDEVDEKWEESLKQNKQPLSGLQRHLKFVADGKQCERLK